MSVNDVVIKRVSRIVAEALEKNKETFDPTVELKQLGADSLKHVEIIMEVEDEFGIWIPDEHAQTLVSTQLIAQYIVDHPKVNHPL